MKQLEVLPRTVVEPERGIGRLQGIEQGVVVAVGRLRILEKAVADETRLVRV